MFPVLRELDPQLMVNDHPPGSIAVFNPQFVDP